MSSAIPLKDVRGRSATPRSWHGKPSRLLGTALSAALVCMWAMPSAQAAGGAQAPLSGNASAALVTDPASLVDPFIGTTNQGNDFPGADSPFGMFQWSPDTNSRPPGGGYEHNDTTITGFSLTHLSGPGCGAEGDIPILPTTGNVDTNANDTFSHSDETANAGDYKVKTSNGVTTELTTTTRTGMAQFTFPSTTQANLILKLNNSQQGDTATNFNAVSSTEVQGSVTSGKFCGPSPAYTVYFDLQFNHPTTSTTNSGGRASVTFDTTGNQTVLGKVGISYVSIANAKANLSSEDSGWDFGATQSAAHAAWNSLLGRVQIGGGTNAQQQEFYTSLYHSLLHPNIASDVNGQYTGMDNKVHTVDSGHSAWYTNFSGWDIYRSQSQLEALVDPAAASDTAQSMLDDYSQDGLLPKWLLDNGENETMVGDPADAIIADYYAFGAKKFDTATALTDMTNEATKTNDIRPGLNYLSSTGYMPHDGSNWGCCNFYGPISTTLEYNTADFALGAFAGALGNTTSQQTFVNRAQEWRNVINPNSGFAEPRDTDGSWLHGFDPTSGNDFVEADSWIYTGMVPFNVAGLATAKGGAAAMNDYLDATLRSYTGANGYAWVGNEPSIELPWEYDYIGEPYKTQATVRSVQDQIWTDAPSGLADGNDDLGAMSAWFVWSALGMFPETPGTPDLALGSPMFTQAVVKLSSGNTLTINGNGAADNAPYVQSASFNGASWNNAYAPGSAITAGGTLSYTLGTAANTSWAAAANQAPPSYPGSVAAPAQPRVGRIASGATTASCIDDASSSTADGTVIQLWGCDGSAAQDWDIANDGTLRTLGKCLDVTANGTSSGTTVELWSCNGGANQQWKQGSNNSVVNPQSGLCLTTGGTGDGSRLTINTCNGSASQSWSYPSGSTPPATAPYVPPASGSLNHTGPIVSGVSSSLCVDDAANSTTSGAKVQIYTCNNTAAQNVTVGSAGTLQINGLCVDVTAAATANGTLVQLYSCNGTGAQVWQPQANGSLLNPASGRCLDDPAASTANGTQLEIWDCNGGSNQKWILP